MPPRLNDPNLPPNPINVSAPMAVTQPGKKYRPQSPEPCDSSPISTPPNSFSTNEGRRTPQKTTDDNTCCSKDEPGRVYWVICPSETFDSNEPRQVSFTSSLSSTPPLPQPQKRKLSMWMSFPQKRGVSTPTSATWSLAVIIAVLLNSSVNIAVK